jgi:hypothetical protein
MPVWTVQLAAGEDERVEAAVLGLDGGALVAVSEEGRLLRAWAPGQWQNVRDITSREAHPAGKANGTGNVLVGLPRS